MHARRIQNFFLQDWLCCFAIGVICSANIYADKYHFDSRGTDSGLPQNSFKAILQTGDGYL